MQFEEAAKKAFAFRDARSWAQFHNPKDLAMSISIESAELLEVFQWSGADLDVVNKRNEVKEELADVLIYCIYMADALGLDLADIVASKVELNEKKYPVEKAWGTARKYDEL